MFSKVFLKIFSFSFSPIISSYIELIGVWRCSAIIVSIFREKKTAKTQPCFQGSLGCTVRVSS